MVSRTLGNTQMCLNNLVSSQVLPKFNHPFILSFNKQMMFGRFFFFFSEFQAAQQNESLSFGTPVLQSGRGRGKASVCCTNEQPECGLREFEKAACSYPFSTNWTSCSPWQGSGDFKGSKRLVSFPCHPVSSGWLHQPQSLPLALTCHPTLRGQRKGMCSSTPSWLVHPIMGHMMQGVSSCCWTRVAHFSVSPCSQRHGSYGLGIR